MNRYLTLIVLVLLYSFCSHSIYDYPQAIDEQQFDLVDDQNSNYPIDDNGKFKNFAFIPQAIFVMIILSVTSAISLFATFTRRRTLLTTIFYQANYLIHSLK